MTKADVTVTMLHAAAEMDIVAEKENETRYLLNGANASCIKVSSGSSDAYVNGNDSDNGVVVESDGNCIVEEDHEVKPESDSVTITMNQQATEKPVEEKKRSDDKVDDLVNGVSTDDDATHKVSVNSISSNPIVSVGGISFVADVQSNQYNGNLADLEMASKLVGKSLNVVSGLKSKMNVSSDSIFVVESNPVEKTCGVTNRGIQFGSFDDETERETPFNYMIRILRNEDERCVLRRRLRPVSATDFRRRPSSATVLFFCFLSAGASGDSDLGSGAGGGRKSTRFGPETASEDDIQQEAYAQLQSLKKQSYEKNQHFGQYRDDFIKANELGWKGDKVALQNFCINQVEKFMDLWNNNYAFRKEYVRCNEGSCCAEASTLWRLRTLDGRSLGPGEVPPVIPQAVNGRAVMDHTMSGLTLEGRTQDEVAVEKAEKVLAAKVVEQKKFIKSAPPESVSATASNGDKIEEAEEEKPGRTREEEESDRKAEELRKEEEADKIKEQRQSEEIAKAKEALERKRRKAEKAHRKKT
ncbi:hypothetical protein PVK06_018279 [Gossypium arboreum]|uniref:Uncharacterized protein n=1 Tax=Gossypium arboreum TaxID=29729 RepID=A0ABR0Q577_GOSAR|nr:hypothetical protein PVK06_018279 [Gossypium arboreum]